MKNHLILLVLVLFIAISPSVGQVTYTYPGGPIGVIYDGSLVEADYWDTVPKILSAGVGFSDIVGISAPMINQTTVMQAGGAWLTDITCGIDNVDFTSTSLVSQVQLIYIYQNEPWMLEDSVIGLDGLPIVFSWPVLSNTVDVTDFRFILNTGDTVTPYLAGMNPNYENNERNCVVIFGELANRLASSDPLARFPVRCEIVDDGTPLLLVGPNNQVVSAVGLSWETTTSPYDPDNGPRLVGAKLNHTGNAAEGEATNSNLFNNTLGSFPNDEFALYGGGDFRLRVLTSGGFSPDGVRPVKPTDYERFFRIHAIAPDNSTMLLEKTDTAYNVKGGTLTILGLADLGQSQGTYDDCYDEDKDNYIDIILEGDEAAARNITHIEIPSLAGGYDAFYNPGGPGTTPFPGVAYTSPGPSDLEPVLMALDNPMRVNGDSTLFLDTTLISSVSGFKPKVNVQVYPNPFNQQITIQGSTGHETIILRNAIGQQVYQGSHVTSISTADYPSGLYFLEVINDDNREVLKLIKQ